MSPQQLAQRTAAARAALAAGNGHRITPWPRRRAELRALFAQHPQLTSLEVATHLGLGRNSASKALSAALDEGLVIKRGRGMNTEYRWVATCMP